jgi:hypothetical protein
MSTSKTTTIKLSHNGGAEKRRLQADLSEGIDGLRAALLKKLGLKPGTNVKKVEWKDEEGDWIALMSDSDVEEVRSLNLLNIRIVTDAVEEEETMPKEALVEWVSAHLNTAELDAEGLADMAPGDIARVLIGARIPPRFLMGRLLDVGRDDAPEEVMSYLRKRCRAVAHAGRHGGRGGCRGRGRGRGGGGRGPAGHGHGGMPRWLRRRLRHHGDHGGSGSGSDEDSDGALHSDSEHVDAMMPPPPFAPHHRHHGRHGHGHGGHHHGHHRGHHHDPEHYHGVKSNGHRHPRGPGRKPAARFVSHVTLSPESIVAAGANVSKTWRVRNDSEQAWPEDVALVYIGGEDSDCLAHATNIPVRGAVPPGGEVDVTLEFTAPPAPGRYQPFWRLVDVATGARFGNRLWATFVVAAESTTDATSSSSSSSSSDGEGVGVEDAAPAPRHMDEDERSGRVIKKERLRELRAARRAAKAASKSEARASKAAFKHERRAIKVAAKVDAALAGRWSDEWAQLCALGAGRPRSEGGRPVRAARLLAKFSGNVERVVTTLMEAGWEPARAGHA